MTMVGIVYSGSSALYCEDYGDHYWVENGAWGFLKSVTSHFHFVDHSGQSYGDKESKKEPNPWRVVIPDMSIHKEEIAKLNCGGSWYEGPCYFITLMAEKQKLPMEPQEQFSMF